jgi:hypothetical protein
MRYKKGKLPIENLLEKYLEAEESVTAKTVSSPGAGPEANQSLRPHFRGSKCAVQRRVWLTCFQSPVAN